MNPPQIALFVLGLYLLVGLCIWFAIACHDRDARKWDVMAGITVGWPDLLMYLWREGW